MTTRTTTLPTVFESFTSAIMAFVIAIVAVAIGGPAGLFVAVPFGLAGLISLLPFVWPVAIWSSAIIGIATLLA